MSRKSSKEMKLNSFRKSESVHNVDENHLQQSPVNLTNEQMNIIEQFLQVNRIFLLRKCVIDFGLIKGLFKSISNNNS